jgi:nucleotide-binding universal stress UspA family protein
MLKPGVVAGFDGSASSARALEWAAGEAKLRGVRLTVCHAWAAPVSAGAISPATTEPTRQDAKDILARGMMVAGRHAAGRLVQGLLLSGPAAPALVHASQDAELLVAGSRGAGSSCRLGLGSLSAQLTMHACCPVEIIRGSGAWRGSAVVVGVDGSPSSHSAAGFAFEQAALRGLPLTAVSSWWEPRCPADPENTDALDFPRMRQRARDRAESVTSQWREKFPEVSFTSSFVMEPPRVALCEAAQAAGLLVVGARGLGGIPGLLLGSVSQAVLAHAPCPVAVIRLG